MTGNSGQADEQGTCTLKDGAQCDAWDYYNGKCDASTATAAPAMTDRGRHDRDGGCDSAAGCHD